MKKCLLLLLLVSMVGCGPSSPPPGQYRVNDHELDQHEGWSREAERNRIRRDDFRRGVSE